MSGTDKTSTREKLTDLGEAAIRSVGYGGFSYADLARDAGIRKASIHHHFPTKADLGREVLKRYGERLGERLDQIVTTGATAADALRAVVALYRDALSDGSTLCLCVALAGDGERLDERLQERLSATNRMVAKRTAEILERGAQDGSLGPIEHSGDEAIAILAHLQGAQLVARAVSDVQLFDIATSGLVDRYASK